MSKEINNNIEEPYCSYEVSELLKDKGFNCRTNIFYNYKKQLSRYFNPDMDWNDINTQGLLNSKITVPNTICAPTHGLAIEWIRVNFDIHISITLEINGEFSFYIENYDLKDLSENCLNIYKTPKEATEAALLYTLKELI